ncbi:MAG: hypothetical protein AAFV53_16905 [Myxococcota bacterium]
MTVLWANLLLALLGTAWAQNRDDCTTAAQYIYVMTSRRQLVRFHPQRLTFHPIGEIQCENQFGSVNSMAVARDGTARVVFTNGQLFQVDTRTAACSPTGYTPYQNGFSTFGMGYAIAPNGSDTLYISANSKIGGGGFRLAKIEGGSPNVVGSYDKLAARAELSGTADGRLFGAFEGSPFVIAEIDPATASVLSMAPQNAIRYSHNSSNFAFAHWGGKFYLFVGQGGATDVYQYAPDTGVTLKVADTPLTIVGAGVSTCAPTEFPTEDFTTLDPTKDNGQRTTPPDPPDPPDPPEDQGTWVIETDAPDGLQEPGSAITVTGGVRDENGDVQPIDGGSFTVTDQNGDVTEHPGKNRDDGLVEAEIPLKDEGPLDITFTPGPMSRPAGVDLSPVSDSSVTVQVGWSLKIDISALPTVCYTNAPCAGDANIIVEGNASGGLIGDPQTRVKLVEEGVPVSAQPLTQGKTTYTVSQTYGAPGMRTWTVTLDGPRGVVESDTHTVEVREPLILNLPDAIDFGTLTAGAGPKETCQPLDFTGSTAAEGQDFVLSLEGVDGCLSAPQVHTSGFRDLTTPQTIQPGAAICLSVPFCAADRSPDGAMLVVTPGDQTFADQQTRLAMRWTVEGRSWISCNGFWVWPTVGGVSLLFIIIGFVRPRRFPAGAFAQMAGSLKGIKRASPVELKMVSGARAGFYRDARLGLHGDGSLRGRTRGALAVLRPSKRGVVVEPKGTIEAYDRRRRAWEPVELQRGVLEPNPRETYRVGDVYFRIEAE